MPFEISPALDDDLSLFFFRHSLPLWVLVALLPLCIPIIAQKKDRRGRQNGSWLLIPIGKDSYPGIRWIKVVDTSAA